MYLLDSPIVVPQILERDYSNNHIAIKLFYNGENIAEKRFKDNYSYNGFNDENVIYIAGTCIWIGYLYGDLGSSITNVLLGGEQGVKQPKFA